MIAMREIPPGSYEIGAGEDDKFALDCERPRRRVRIPGGTLLGVFPVTEREMGGSSDLPALGVSWLDAGAFCKRLSEETGRLFRLPYEAEWEVACRAGTTTPFWTGTTLPQSAANYLYDESGNRIGPGHRTPRGTYPANPFGFQDMTGNVLEWCADPWSAASADRVLRGGAWDLLPRLLRSSWRDAAPPATRRDNIGFRIACGPR